METLTLRNQNLELSDYLKGKWSIERQQEFTTLIRKCYPKDRISIGAFFRKAEATLFRLHNTYDGAWTFSVCYKTKDKENDPQCVCTILNEDHEMAFIRMWCNSSAARRSYLHSLWEICSKSKYHSEPYGYIQIRTRTDHRLVLYTKEILWIGAAQGIEMFIDPIPRSWLSAITNLRHKGDKIVEATPIKESEFNHLFAYETQEETNV